MDLKVREIVLIAINEPDGLIRGKTLLQKRIYFLDILQKLNLGYRPHYYGPYSPRVEEALGDLKGLRFVEERQTDFNPNEEGFKVRRYDYKITEDGEIIIQLLKDRKNEDFNLISESLKTIKDAGDPDYLTLSVAAKTHYILSRQNFPMTIEEIIKVGKELNWKIEPHQIENAARFLEKLNLIKST